MLLCGTLLDARTIDDGEVTDRAAPSSDVQPAAGPAPPAGVPAPEPVRPGFPGGEPFEPEPAKN